MDKEKIYEVLHPNKFKIWIKSSFHEAGITSIEFLKDDKKIEKAAQIAYKKIPRLPYRAIIKTTIGKKGFLKLIFQVRDKMIQAKSLDLSWLNSEYFKSLLANLKK